MQIKLNEAWAMRSDAFVDLVKRVTTASKSKLPKGGMPRFKKPNGKPYEIVGGIAIIRLTGIVLRAYDPWLAMWGFASASTENIRGMLEQALEDSSVRGIVIDSDSPGGELNGTAELAEFIFNSRDKKPIVTYVSNEASSAAYWIGSAAHAMVAHETSLVGSIGVMFNFPEWFGEGSVDIVSSVSPFKIPDIKSDDGRARIQVLADKLGMIFVESVARNRGVKTDIVISDFGQGDVLLGADAKAAGMVDAVGNFETALNMAKELVDKDIADIIGSIETGAASSPKPERKVMKIFAKILNKAKAKLVVVDDEEVDVEGMPVEDIDANWVNENLPDIAEQFREEGRQEETDRQGEMDDVQAGTDEEKAAVREARRDRKQTAGSVALKIHKMRAEKSKAAAVAREQDAAGLDVETPTPADENDEEAVISIMREAGKKAFA